MIKNIVNAKRSMFKPKVIFLTAILITIVASVAYAGSIAVIVNKSNGEAIDKAKLNQIFTKEYRVWSNGEDVVPIDLKSGDAYASFIKTVIGKTENQVKSYWIQQKITKNLKEPLSFTNAAKVKSFVSKIENSIGYIPKSDVDDSVKVAFEID